MYRVVKSGRKFKKALIFLMKYYYPRRKNDHNINRCITERKRKRERELLPQHQPSPRITLE